MTDDPLKNRDVIFEFVTIGVYVKATAVDVATMTEGSIQGPASSSQAILKAGALKKLEFVLRKKGLIE